MEWWEAKQVLVTGFAYWPCWLLAGKGKPKTIIVAFYQFNRWELRTHVANSVKKTWWDKMRVAVYNHATGSILINGEQNYADLLAIASLIALIRIGNFSKRISNAETASLIALDIAAGDPRYPLSPDPFCPNTVCGEGVQCLTI